MWKYKKIIVRLPNWIGDLVMATPILHDIRYAFPQARITALGLSPSMDLISCDPNVDDLLSFERDPKKLDHLRGKNIVERIRQEHFDLGILLPNSFSSAYWFWQGGVKYRLGFPYAPRGALLNLKAPFPEMLEEQHQVVTYKHILTPLGIPISSSRPMLYLSNEEKEVANGFLNKEGRRLIGINPGAAYGSAKCWLPERFSLVAKRLLEADPELQIVFFGTAEMAEMIEKICHPLKERVFNACGQTSIRQLAACIAQCDAFLTNDSGPMHIAAALQVPLLALFGSTSEVRTGPYEWGEVIRKNVKCSPCYKRVCPIDFRCMTQISVEEVSEKLLQIAASSVKEKVQC